MWGVLQMGIMFQNFEDKKSVRKNFVMGFGSPENAKNNLFDVFGSLSQLSNAV